MRTNSTGSSLTLRRDALPSRLRHDALVELADCCRLATSKTERPFSSVLLSFSQQVMWRLRMTKSWLSRPGDSTSNSVTKYMLLRGLRFLNVQPSQLYTKARESPEASMLAFLKSNQKYRTTSWVIVDTSRVPKGTEVDLIGYPGDYTMAYLSQLIGYPLATDEEYNQVRKIVPANRLLVSHGKVVEENDRLVYKLSTTGGMSGGPVIYNNKVIGIPCGNFH